MLGGGGAAIGSGAGNAASTNSGQPRTLPQQRGRAQQSRRMHAHTRNNTASAFTAAGQSTGYCALHHRKRVRSDLMSWHEQPGRSRCRLQKECRARDAGSGGAAGTVVCRIHRKRRKAFQMREVGKGVWECPAHASCTNCGTSRMGPSSSAGVHHLRSARTGGVAPSFSAMALRNGMRGHSVGSSSNHFMNNASAVPGQRRVSFAQPTHGHRAGHRAGDVRQNYLHNNNNNNNSKHMHVRHVNRQANARDRYDGQSAGMWAPARHDASGAAGDLHDQRSSVSAAGGVRMPMDKKVWCALHGKLLLSSQCYSLDGFCHICYDAGFCLSTPLDAASELMGKGCAELLCSQHRTLRSVGFLELDDRLEDKIGYKCLHGHPCRGLTVVNDMTGDDGQGGDEDTRAMEAETAPYAAYAAPYATGATDGMSYAYENNNNVYSDSRDSFTGAYPDLSGTAEVHAGYGVDESMYSHLPQRHTGIDQSAYASPFDGPAPSDAGLARPPYDEIAEEQAMHMHEGGMSSGQAVMRRTREAVSTFFA